MTMGSGKTRVAVDFVEGLWCNHQVVGGCVFVLNSTKYQWEREINLWAPGASVQVIDGDKRYRYKQYKQAHSYRYTILNYDLLVHDWGMMAEHLPIDFVIIDEATAIKSFRAKRSKMIKTLGDAAAYRLALSGQPVENKPEELFSIMEFVDPKVLGPFYRFDRTFIKRDTWGKPIKYMNLPLLRKSLSEAMFRRTRKDIEQYLPKMVTLETPVRLDSWSQKLYDHIVDDLLMVIDEAMAAGMSGFDVMAHYGRADSHADNRFKGEVMSRITALRMLCDHPQLLRKSAEDFDDPDSPMGSQYAATVLKGASVPTASNKLDALMEQVKEILTESDDHKVVIFSGFKAMLAMMSYELKERKVGHTLISGDVVSKLRDERIVKFNTDDRCRVFLSSDAGAYGVNLNAGSHLISYDLPWSAGGYAQRMARIDRISSLHDNIYINSMFGRDTIEARQLEMLRQKQLIGAAFLDGQYDPKGTLNLDLSSLREFLVGT